MARKRQRAAITVSELGEDTTFPKRPFKARRRESDEVSFDSAVSDNDDIGELPDALFDYDDDDDMYD